MSRLHLTNTEDLECFQEDTLFQNLKKEQRQIQAGELQPANFQPGWTDCSAGRFKGVPGIEKYRKDRCVDVTDCKTRNILKRFKHDDNDPLLGRH